MIFRLEACGASRVCIVALRRRAAAPLAMIAPCLERMATRPRGLVARARHHVMVTGHGSAAGSTGIGGRGDQPPGTALVHLSRMGWGVEESAGSEDRELMGPAESGIGSYGH